MIAAHGGGVDLTANVSQRKLTEILRRQPEGAQFSYVSSDGTPASVAPSLTVTFDWSDLDNYFRVTVPGGNTQISATKPDNNTLSSRQKTACISLAHKKYSRLVDNVDVADLPSERTLKFLGGLMSRVPRAAASSEIPVEYTYLGQFIAHDLAHTDFENTDACVFNLQTHALDLSSLFGNDPVSCFSPDDADGVGGVRLGLTQDIETGALHRFEDLPRSQAGAFTGRSCITDRRNDANLALSQLTVLLLKFYRLVFSICGNDAAAARETTRRHFQSIVLHDFLPRVLWNRTFINSPQSLNDFDRKIVNTSNVANFFQIPAEFAGAFFRFGHSLVKNRYLWGSGLDNQTLNLQDLLDETYLGDLSADRNRLDDAWVLDWPLFTDGQLSDALDCGMQTELTGLNRKFISHPPFEQEEYNLAILTLLRGRKLRLPTVAALRDELANSLGEDAEELNLLQDNDVLSPFGSGPAMIPQENLDDLQGRIPLFLYTLRESHIRAGGQHLGPLASRIILETIHAAIAAADNNIITGTPFMSHEDLPVPQQPVFGFQDLLECVNAQPA